MSSTGTNNLCPCCGKVTVSEYDICPVCTWENDPIQTERPDFRGGANVMSLIEAKQAFAVGKKIM